MLDYFRNFRKLNLSKISRYTVLLYCIAHCCILFSSIIVSSTVSSSVTRAYSALLNKVITLVSVKIFLNVVVGGVKIGEVIVFLVDPYY